MRTRRFSVSVMFAFAVCLLLLTGLPAAAQAQHHGPIVIPEVTHVTTPPLRDMVRTAPPATSQHILPLRQPPAAQNAVEAGEDTAIQRATGPLVGTTNLLNFDGISANGFAPPDTNASVGATQVVETVNLEYAIYDKTTGNVDLAPTNIQTLYTPLGGVCGTGNLSDPVVLYDKAAGRWVITIVGFNNSFSSNLQCVAVSTTSDATGSYNLYAFSFGANLNDYAKLGVWPDAYYFSANMFANGATFIGAQACAFDRTSMLAGTTATAICFQEGSGVYSLLPSDLDGATAPPSGEPNFFLELASTATSGTKLDLFKFHVDFTTPSNSTFTGPTSITVTSYRQACNGGTCIPQSGTSQKLDSLGNRLMFRLSYRNFGTYESLLATQSANVTAKGVRGNQAGPRWYEIRSPNGTPVVFQQGSFAPDTTVYRWMPSIAQDKLGDIAVGYSASNSSLHPGIRYTGRVPTDALGTLEAESTIFTGAGSQNGGLSRWGDYSSLSIDPSDDCTFWYASEYIPSNGSFNWHTRLASFRFTSCP